MSAFRPIQIDRQQYWSGQVLSSSDASREIAAAEQLRWWHTRALHGAAGVVCGLEVTLDDAVVTVRPGLAFDGYGREVFLPRTATIALPDQDEAWLTLAQGGDEGEPQVACDRLSGAAAIAWSGVNDIERCRAVPLARWQKHRPGELVVPRARPRRHARPRVAAGATLAGTRWAPVESGGRAIGVETVIDTSAAGFTTTPCYFARPDLSSERATVTGADDAITRAAWLLMIGLSHVTDATATSFRVRAIVPDRTIRTGPVEAPLLALFRTAVIVRWIAVEPASPAASLSRHEVKHR